MTHHRKKYRTFAVENSQSKPYKTAVMKKILPDLIAILAFALLSFAYFFPADIENRILFQHDTAAGAGAGQEVKEYYEQTGERSRWTNSLFGGMPMYQIAPS